MPEISVIVPVYNCQQYIMACVDSILNQTFSDFEIILVDDGSPDNSGKLCDELAEKYPDKIIVLHQENRGQGAARNNGVKIARGEWLHFVDSDDIIHPQMLETLYVAAKENNVKLSLCSVVNDNKIPDDFYFEATQNFEIFEMNEENLLFISKNSKYYYWIACGKLIHKSVFKKHPFTEGKFYEDNAVVCKWLYEAKTVAITDAALYFYYINTESTTQKNFNEKQLDVLWAFREQIEFFESLGYKKMLSYLCTFFFDNSHCVYLRAKAGNADKKIFSTIKNNEVYIKKNYSEYVNLNYENTLYYYKKANIIIFYLIRIKNKLGLLLK